MMFRIVMYNQSNLCYESPVSFCQKYKNAYPRERAGHVLHLQYDFFPAPDSGNQFQSLLSHRPHHDKVSRFRVTELYYEACTGNMMCLFQFPYHEILPVPGYWQQQILFFRTDIRLLNHIALLHQDAPAQNNYQNYLPDAKFLRNNADYIRPEFFRSETPVTRTTYFR